MRLNEADQPHGIFVRGVSPLLRLCLRQFVFDIIYLLLFGRRCLHPLCFPSFFPFPAPSMRTERTICTDALAGEACC
jgi:hypothetical protein